MPGGRAALVSTTWLVVAAVGVATVAIKATGPVMLGGRSLPARLAGIVDLLAPALLSALVVTQALADGRAIVLDARLVGVAAAGIALWLKAPILLVIVVAAAATAVTRLLV